VNFFQPSFKLKEKRREGAKVIKRYHLPATPYARALAHAKVGKAVKQQLRAIYRTFDPVALLAEVRAAQDMLGTRVNSRTGKMQVAVNVSVNQVDVDQSIRREVTNVASPAMLGTAAFAKALGRTSKAAEPRATHRRLKRQYKTRMRMPSMLDPHLIMIKGWLTAEPQLTALTILGRLIECYPSQFDARQASIVQRLLKALRIKAAQQIIADAAPQKAVPVPIKFGPYTMPQNIKTPFDVGNIST
jgi:hypothetical protein